MPLACLALTKLWDRKELGRGPGRLREGCGRGQGRRRRLWLWPHHHRTTHAHLMTLHCTRCVFARQRVWHVSRFLAIVARAQGGIQVQWGLWLGVGSVEPKAADGAEVIFEAEASRARRRLWRSPAFRRHACHEPGRRPTYPNYCRCERSCGVRGVGSSRFLSYIGATAVCRATASDVTHNRTRSYRQLFLPW